MKKNPMRTPATAESGFMLSLPPSENAFTSDLVFRRILECRSIAHDTAAYLPPTIYASTKRDLISLADEARSARMLALMSNAEKDQPYVNTHDSWGKRFDIDKLVTSEGWRELGKWGAERGVIAMGYGPDFGEFRRIVQFASLYIYGPSSGGYSCPFAMTDGAARLLAVQNENLPPSHPFHEVFGRLTARVDSWTSGQWMTERAGGSDVQNTETWATYSPLAQKTGEYGRIDEGDYLVSGFKFFSSATDANIAILLAKTESGKLSVFLAPLTKLAIDAQGNERRVTNGIRIHRLKKKLGTKQLPTAELELKDVRAHLVGPLDRGVATISTLLNITRVHTFNGTVAGLGRCLAIAKAFAKARTTRGQALTAVPLHLRTLADVELKRRGILHLSQFTTALVGFIESGFPAQKPAGLSCLPTAGIEADIVLRALTATAKAFCSKVVIQGAQECMEAMGGVGYIDDPDDSEHNVARLYRDLTVNATWEGTTNVMSSELLRFISGRDNLGVLSQWVGRNVERIVDETYRNALRQSWESLHARLKIGTVDLDEVLGDGRRGLFSLGWVVCGLLLVTDAERDGDPLAAEAARRWVLGGEGGVGEWVFRDVFRVGDNDFRPSDFKTRAKWDYKFLYGEDSGREEVSRL